LCEHAVYVPRAGAFAPPRTDRGRRRLRRCVCAIRPVLARPPRSGAALAVDEADLRGPRVEGAWRLFVRADSAIRLCATVPWPRVCCRGATRHRTRARVRPVPQATRAVLRDQDEALSLCGLRSRSRPMNLKDRETGQRAVDRCARARRSRSTSTCDLPRTTCATRPPSGGGHQRRPAARFQRAVEWLAQLREPSGVAQRGGILASERSAANMSARVVRSSVAVARS
jgi:hypothetical protein